MNGSVSSLIETLRRSLREAVQPDLTNDHSRAQLAGAMDILSKLERMTDWSPTVLDEQLRVLRAGIDAITQCAGELGVTLPPAPSSEALDLPMAQAYTRELSDWLFSAQLDAGARAALDAILRGALHEDVALQRKRIPRADFSSMTASSD